MAFIWTIIVQGINSKSGPWIPKFGKCKCENGQITKDIYTVQQNPHFIKPIFVYY